MVAYVIFIREDKVHDPAAMQTYLDMGRSKPVNPKLKPLALYGKMETIEGEPADGVVILEFPTMADAKAWYYSPDYQASSPYRRKAAPYRGMIVEGL